tara:strand:+ start:2793 stop:3998 length:1206 start_codon:yes stop_codon:yes gene_type:complete
LKSKVLIVSYSLGNNKSVGGKRWLNFSNYLASYGHKVFVLATSRNIDFKNLDKNIGVNLIRSNYPSILNKNQLNFLEKILYRLTVIYRLFTIKGSIYDKGKKLEYNLIKKIKKIVDENNVNNIIVSGAPFSFLYFVTKHFKDKLNIICDFRDPWSWGIGYGMSNLSSQRISFEKVCENFVLKNSNYLICASLDLSFFLNEKLIVYDKKAIVLINTLNDFTLSKKQINKSESNGVLSICHVGTIASKTEKYWMIFLDLIELSKFEILLNIYGNNNINFYNDVKKRDHLKVNFFERIDEKLLSQKFLSNDILLLFKMDAFPNSFPTKFFDYIRAQKPIMAFTKKGIFSEEIENNKIGQIFNEKSNIDEFDDFLSSFRNINYNNYNFLKFEISSELQKLNKILK